MSACKSISVTRSYTSEADACARALALLLKRPVSKEGGPHTAPDDAKKEFKHVGAKSRIP